MTSSSSHWCVPTGSLLVQWQRVHLHGLGMCRPQCRLTSLLDYVTCRYLSFKNRCYHILTIVDMIPDSMPKKPTKLTIERENDRTCFAV